MTTMTAVETRSWRPLRMVRDPLTWRAALYLQVSMGLGLAWFVFLTVGISLSVGLMIIWVGFPLAALLITIVRAGTVLERAVMRAAFGAKIQDPFRPLPEGHLFRKLRALVVDPAMWKGLGYFAVLFPITLIEFVISTALWFVGGVLLIAPVLALFTRVTMDFGGDTRLIVDQPLEGIPFTPVGAAVVLAALYVTRVMGTTHATLAGLLLGPGAGQAENQVLRARADHLQASRARGVDAAESERRRIERDLHDGAQQRLLAVAMDIGRARAKLDEDPVGARALIEQAHAGTKEAISELRDLARGIYPAILTDRGLDPALSGLAARAPVPVEVEVDLPDRPPAAVESIAYFIVAESLANIAKYARATRASIKVSRDDHWVIVEISDNGVGGAMARRGGGLAGLADRAATIDGILTVNSPPGGPTVIRADLPCTW